MTEEFKYRPPIKYLFVGVCGLISFAILGLAMIKGGEIWFVIVIGIFFLMSLVLGIGFLTIYFRKFNVGNLKLGNDFIEIPGRWKDKTRLNFSDILDIGEFDTYDNVIEIQSKIGVFLIERQWMKKQEFEKLRNKLADYWGKK